MSPSPIIAEATNDPVLFVARFTITFRETAGLGANVDFFNITLRNSVGLESPAFNHGADEVIRAAGTNHLAARGSLAIPFAQSYFNGLGTRSIIIIVVAQLTDERGNRINVSGQVEAFSRASDARLPH
jgi:hypothetical protein